MKNAFKRPFKVLCSVLQLTSYDEEQSDLDNLTVLKKLQNAIQNKLNAASDWLLVSVMVTN